MHPVLLEIPLASLSIPLGPALLALAAMGLLVAVVGRRAKARDLLLLGATVALAGVAGAAALRGHNVVLRSLPLSSYGVTLCLALVVAWRLTLGLAARDGLAREPSANSFIVAAIAGLVVARVLYAATNPDQFGEWREIVDVHLGGLAAYGALLGGALGAWGYMRARGLPLLPWGDVAVPSAALAVTMGGTGSYLLGSGYGTPLGAQAPGWLRRLGTFPRWGDDVLQGAGSPAWIDQVSEGLLSFDSAAALPVHPTQLYTALGGLVLVGLLFVVRQRQSFRGQVLLAFVFGYACLRFGVDWLRGDPERGLIGPHVAEHRLWAIGTLMLAAGFAYGPARSLRDLRWRRVAQAGSVLPALFGYLTLRPAAFVLAESVQLSVAQWLGLATAVAAAAAWAALAPLAGPRAQARARRASQRHAPAPPGAQAEPDGGHAGDER